MFRNKASSRTRLTIRAEDGTIDEITSTPGHKYYLTDNKANRNPNEKLEHASYDGLNDKWVSACLLKKGDRVLLANADSLTGKPKFGIVIAVKTEECEEFTTYNFEVADFHTYYVGENGVCVHNMNCDFDEIMNSKFHDGTDCSEIADELYSAAGRRGQIIEIKSNNGSQLMVRQNGIVEPNYYHTVYKNGKYIYDPRFSVTRVRTSAYMKNLSELNPQGFYIKRIK